MNEFVTIVWNIFAFRLPDDVSAVDEPILGRWIEEANVWRNDGFLDCHYNEGTRYSQTARVATEND